MAFVPTQTPTLLLPAAPPDASAPSGPFAAPVPFTTMPEEVPTDGNDPRDAFAALLASITAPAPAAPAAATGIASAAPAALETVALGQTAQGPAMAPPSPEAALAGLRTAVEALPIQESENGPADAATADAALQPTGSTPASPADGSAPPADDGVTPPLPMPPSPVAAPAATDEQAVQTDRTGSAQATQEVQTAQADQTAQAGQTGPAPATITAGGEPEAAPVAPAPAWGDPAPGSGAEAPRRSDTLPSTPGDDPAPARAADHDQANESATRKATADKAAADIALAQARPLAQSDAPEPSQPLPARSDTAAARGPLGTAAASTDRTLRVPTAGGDTGLGTAGRNATPQAPAPQAPQQAPGNSFAALLGTGPRNADQPDSPAPRMAAASDAAAPPAGDPLAGLKSLSLAGGAAPQAPQQASAAAPAPTPAAHLPPHTPAVSVSLGIAKALSEGHSRITVRLDPPELGRVEIRLDFTGDGTVRALIRADNHHTLDLLQRDSRLLERALGDSGLKADSGSLSFSLNQGGQDAAFAGNTHGGRDGGGPPLGAAPSEHVEASEETALEYELTGTAQGGVNLVI